MSDLESKLREAKPDNPLEERPGFGFWQWHAPTSRLDWSAGMYRVLGLDPAAITPGFGRILQLVHPDDQPHIFDPTDPTRDPTPIDVSVRVVRPDGETRRVRHTIDVRRDADGKPTQIIGSLRDETPPSGSDGLSPGPMTPELVRAARGYLDWSANKLAEKANVSFSTVRRAEATGDRHLRDGSLTAIRVAFEAAGVRFVTDAEGNPGLIAG